MLNKAFKLAIEKHDVQMYGRKPYFCHLLDVYNLVYKYDNSPLTLSLALLHDIKEDTSVSLYELHNISIMLPEYVQCLTKYNFESKKLYYIKCSKYYATKLVKICDRICNIKECIRLNNRSQFLKYYADKKEFRILYPKLPVTLILKLELLYLYGFFSTYRIHL